MKTVSIWLMLLVLLGSILWDPTPARGDQTLCDTWMAKIVSVQGRVEIKRHTQREWTPVSLNDTCCPQDTVRVLQNSRAALLLPNDTILRLKESTVITLEHPPEEQSFWVKLLQGAFHFFSRTPWALKFSTPFVNGVVEGTEFFVQVEKDRTFFSVFEGSLVTENRDGRLKIRSGQTAETLAGQAPKRLDLPSSRDAVHWAVYYPPILDYRPQAFPGKTQQWHQIISQAIESLRVGDPRQAIDRLQSAPLHLRDSDLYVLQAGIMLSVGNITKAEEYLQLADTNDARNCRAVALRSIIALAHNKNQTALELARQALGLNHQCPAGHLALSYALQSRFDLQGALRSVLRATQTAPENALLAARLAELRLSLGDLDQALQSARKAVSLNPKLAKTETVLGFAYLMQFKTQKAIQHFQSAIRLDQGAPLPRLGLGLAQIREGKLKQGRTEMEIAVILDPTSSLLRSYLGKAYYDEKRNQLAASQYAQAKKMDPYDPTPWFYDAIRKQTQNRPVEALTDLQHSIRLNDNRGVYRSRLLLDQDLAARSAALGRIYKDLGFEHQAFLQGWKSLSDDPANFSAHRLLADTYSARPRHEIARVSELLQSQLLQPLNVNPIQPHLGESNIYLLEGSGPTDPSFNEFNPLFQRNRLTLQATGLGGGKDTIGDEVVHSGLWDNFSYSLGQFHFQSDGLRENNDQNLNLYNLFAQMNIHYSTSMQAEYRYKDQDTGDLSLLYNPENYMPDLSKKEETQSWRFGLRHTFGPGHDLLFSWSYLDKQSENKPYSWYKSTIDHQGFLAEAQDLLRWDNLKLTTGFGHFNADRKDTSTYSGYPPEITEGIIRHTNAYLYSLITCPANVTWTLGGSLDLFDDHYWDLEVEQFNPKLGVTWNPMPKTTVRAAVFRTLKRTLLGDQTLEPTQIAGFNQFFDDGDAADTWRYGIGLDQQWSDQLYSGIELSRRNLQEWGQRKGIQEFDSEEEQVRVYMNWAPHLRLALSPQYLYEHFENPEEFIKDEQITRLETHRFSLGMDLSFPSGFSVFLQPSYVMQQGRFFQPPSGPMNPPSFVTSDSSFWVLDASLSYRLPNRLGLISLEAKNLFNNSFRFQNTDPADPEIYPEQLIVCRFTLAF